MSAIQRDQQRSEEGNALTRLRIGTRGSRLALVQSRQIGEKIRRAHPNLEIEYVIIQTTGDRIQDSALGRLAGKGVFTKEIEDALLDGRIDAAIHSLKDLPTRQPPGLTIAAITQRENPADVIVALSEVDLKSLGASARIGTSSPRRKAQIRRLNPHVEIADVRGNIPTRVQKVIEGNYDAIVIAAAGIRRLSLEVPFENELSFDEMLPAAGQGALAVEIATSKGHLREYIACVHDHPTAVCCLAERALLHALGGGCQVPLGILAQLEDGTIHIRARVFSSDGLTVIEDEISGEAERANHFALRLADRLIAKGALTQLDQDRKVEEDNYERAARRISELDNLALGGKTVLVTRDEDTDGPLSLSLRSLGGHPICIPFVRHVSMDDSAEIQHALTSINLFDWIIFTSYRSVHIVVEALMKQGNTLRNVLPRIACVGQATALAVEKAGGRVQLIPTHAQLSALLVALLKVESRPGTKMFYPRADLASPFLAEGLRKAGMIVDDVVVYRTERQADANATEASIAAIQADAVLFCSPSAAEALHDSFTTEEITHLFDHMVIGSIGPRTSEALESMGLNVTFEPEERSFGGLARRLADHFERQAKAGK